MTKYFLIVVFALGITVRCTNSKKTAKQSDPDFGFVSAGINNKNYYDYELGIPGTTTAWLSRQEAIQIIIDELKQLGYQQQEFSIIKLFQLEECSFIPLDVYIYKTNCGILYNTGHYGNVKKSQRDEKSYTDYIVLPSGDTRKKQTFDSLPKNIICLQETWYWYQKSPDKNIKPLVNKATIIEILKQDLRFFIKEHQTNK